MSPLAERAMPTAKTILPRWLRGRVSLKGLLLIPILVAAFFAGSASRHHQLHEAYLQDIKASNELFEQFRREMGTRRPKQRGLDESMMIIDRMEHRERMEKFQRQYQDQ